MWNPFVKRINYGDMPTVKPVMEAAPRPKVAPAPAPRKNQALALKRAYDINDHLSQADQMKNAMNKARKVTGGAGQKPFGLGFGH